VFIEYFFEWIYFFEYFFFTDFTVLSAFLSTFLSEIPILFYYFEYFLSDLIFLVLLVTQNLYAPTWLEEDWKRTLVSPLTTGQFTQSPNLPYSKGVGSPVVALPIWWAS
jgi:hypothetical protein